MNILPTDSSIPPDFSYDHMVLKNDDAMIALSERTIRFANDFKKLGLTLHCGPSAAATYLYLRKIPASPDAIACAFDRESIQKRGANFIQIKSALDALANRNLAGSKNLDNKTIENLLVAGKKPLIAGIQRPGRSNHAITLVGCVPSRSFIYHEPDGTYGEIQQDQFQSACLGILYEADD